MQGPQWGKEKCELWSRKTYYLSGEQRELEGQLLKGGNPLKWQMIFTTWTWLSLGLATLIAEKESCLRG